MSFRKAHHSSLATGLVAAACWLLALTAAPPIRAQEPDDLAAESTSPDEIVERSDLGNVAQTAQMLYHQAVRDLDRAQKLDAKALDADTEKKRDKFVKQSRAARDDAVQQFREAISYKPDLAEAYAGLGRAYREIGETEKALEVHAMALRQWPEDLENFAGWAESLLALDLLANATQAYTAYREPAPQKAEILMREMKEWLTAKRADPGDLRPEDVERLAEWIAQQQGSGS